MEEDQAATLIQKLLIRTKDGSLTWSRAAADETSFDSSFTKAILRISSAEEDDEEWSSETLAIFNEEGELIDSITEEESKELEGLPEYPLFEIYNRARDQALGITSVIDSVLAELDALAPRGG